MADDHLDGQQVEEEGALDRSQVEAVDGFKLSSERKATPLEESGRNEGKIILMLFRTIHTTSPKTESRYLRYVFMTAISRRPISPCCVLQITM